MGVPKLLSHLKDTVVHVTASERTAWNAKANNTDSRLKTSNKELAPAINECFQYANDGKTAIATAITNKGVSAASTETFASLASKVGSIKTGMETYSDSATFAAGVASMTVTGLPFKPKAIQYTIYLTANSVYTSAGISDANGIVKHMFFTGGQNGDLKSFFSNLGIRADSTQTDSQVCTGTPTGSYFRGVTAITDNAFTIYHSEYNGTGKRIDYTIYR